MIVFIVLTTCIVVLLILQLIMAKKKQRLAWAFSDKHMNMFLFMCRWVSAKQVGKRLDNYLINSGYNSIAIYGMGRIGEVLVNELNDSTVSIMYGIDRNPGNNEYAFDVITPDGKLRKVDVIVVTVIDSFREIKEALKYHVDCPIISIEELLYKC